MDHPDFTVSNFMGNSIGSKRVKYSITYKLSRFNYKPIKGAVQAYRLQNTSDCITKIVRIRYGRCSIAVY